MQQHAIVHRNEPDTRDPVFNLPGACDCHVHVFGPQDRFPYAAERRYTPPDALIGDYQAAMRTVGLDRAVLTAPSVHGLDNRALLHGLRTGGASLRGVAMVAADVSDAALRELHAAGVRAIRTQLKPGGSKPLTLGELRALAERVAPLGWHVEIHLDVSALPDIDELCAGFPVPVVIEHMGHLPTSRGLDNPGFRALLRFLASGAWVKLSGAYIASETGAPYEDVRPFAEALLEAAPQRAVWGSNWPHPHQDTVPDDRELARTLSAWTDDAALLREVLVDNPGTLYNF
jgi:predicted TIM-barrel fold metal-dependent hydrolase